MYKYFVFDEDGTETYFRTLKDIAQFIGVSTRQVRIGLHKGVMVEGYFIDEIIK